MRSSSSTGVGPNKLTIRARSLTSGSLASGSSSGSPSSIGRPMIGSTASMTSEASVIRGAPCLIRSLGPGGGGRGGSGEHLAALFGGNPRGDQRSRAKRGLDHDHAERRAGDQPVAPWKVAGARHVAERHFRDRASRRYDRG